MSQFCVTTKSNLSVLMSPDFFMHRGVYGEVFERERWGIRRFGSAIESRVLRIRLVAHCDEKSHAVLATLEDCHASLVLSGDHDTAQLVSVAILELRIKLNRIEDSELKALCDAMLREGEADASSAPPRRQEGTRQRGPVSLKLVK